MAIKTVREGRLPVRPTLAGTCSHCGWAGECDVADARDCSHPMDSNRSYAVDCPTSGCGRFVVMAKKQVRVSSACSEKGL